MLQLLLINGSERSSSVRIETLLNRVYWLKSFVYEGVRQEEIGGREALVVEIRPRANGSAICSGCQEARSVLSTHASLSTV